MYRHVASQCRGGGRDCEREGNEESGPNVPVGVAATPRRASKGRRRTRAKASERKRARRVKTKPARSESSGEKTRKNRRRESRLNGITGRSAPKGTHVGECDNRRTKPRKGTKKRTAKSNKKQPRGAGAHR